MKHTMVKVVCPQSPTPVWANSCKSSYSVPEFRCTKCGNKGHSIAKKDGR